MAKYLVKITGEAEEYSFGGSRSYEVKKEKRFDANDDLQAKEMAEQYRREVSMKLLCPREIKILSLEQTIPVL